jgi:hypothetical protein
MQLQAVLETFQAIRGINLNNVQAFIMLMHNFSCFGNVSSNKRHQPEQCPSIYHVNAQLQAVLETFQAIRGINLNNVQAFIRLMHNFMLCWSLAWPIINPQDGVMLLPLNSVMLKHRRLYFS